MSSKMDHVGSINYKMSFFHAGKRMAIANVQRTSILLKIYSIGFDITDRFLINYLIYIF